MFDLSKYICYPVKDFRLYTPVSRTISLRLLALILCSNCSNKFNNLLGASPLLVKLFFALRGALLLATSLHAWSRHFTHRLELCNPPTPLKT